MSFEAKISRINKKFSYITEVEWFYEDLQDFLELTPQKRSLIKDVIKTHPVFLAVLSTSLCVFFSVQVY